MTECKLSPAIRLEMDSILTNRSSPLGFPTSCAVDAALELTTLVCAVEAGDPSAGNSDSDVAEGTERCEGG